jgi:tetratricopeptide (TPR) repeat protein
LAVELAGSDSRNVQAHSALYATTRRMATAVRDSDPAQALRLYRAALTIGESSLALDPRNADAARNHGFNLFETAYPLSKLGDRAGALRMLRQALAQQRANAAADSARVQFRQDMIPTHIALAAMLVAGRDFTAAQVELESGMKLAQTQMEAAPRNLYSIRNFADCLEGMAGLELARGNQEAATRLFERSRALWTDWERAHGPNAYQRSRLARL